MRALSRGCNSIDILVRGVARKNCAGLTNSIELGENFFLELKIFEYRLDNHVYVGKVGIVCCAAYCTHTLSDLCLGELAFLHCDCVVFLDNAETSCERLVINLDHDNLNTNVRETHGDAATHGAAANDCDFLYLTQRRVSWQIFDFCSLTLGEENMAHCGRFGRGHQFHKEFSLTVQACVHRLTYRRFDARNDTIGGDLPARSRSELLACSLEETWLNSRRIDCYIADALKRRTGCNKLFCVGNRASLHVIARNYLVDQIGSLRFLCCNRVTRGNHI